MSTLRTTNIIHGSSAISNIVLDNQGRAIFGPDSPAGRAALYVNAQNNRVGVNTESPAVALDVDGAINATGNVAFGGTFSVTGNTTLGGTLTVTGNVIFNGASLDLNSNLDVTGNSTFTGDVEITGDLTVDTDTLFVNSSTSRVGISTTSPSAMLDARGQVRLGNQANGDGTTIINTSNGVYIGTNDGGTTTTVVPLQIGGYPASPSFSGTPDHAIVLDGWSGSTIYHNAIVNRRGRDLSFHTAITGNGFSDTNERVRIDSSGKVLIGTSTARTIATQSLAIQNEGTSFNTTGFSTCRNSNDQYGPYVHFGKTRGTLVGSNTIVANGDDLGGLIWGGGDGTDVNTQAAYLLCQVDGTPGVNDMPGRLVFSTTPDGASGPIERMRITSGGELQMLRTISTNYIKTGNTIRTANGNNTLISYYHGYYTPRMVAAINCNTVSNAPNIWGAGSLVFYTGTSGNNDAGNGLAARMTISYTGAVSIVGSLSKGSGSFKIDHPLPEKAETHHLVHSFIEGPQADLIYRGHVQLVGGRATVNIDEAGRMSKGTFEALCTNVCCFTSNESDWTAVRGSVSGNILTIEAQDEACTAEVCWMVVGERKDPHMLKTEWTDENGRVITEPLKASEETEPSQA